MEPLNFVELRAKIAASRKILDEQERALNVVEEMVRSGDAPQATGNGRLQLAEREFSVRVPSTSLIKPSQKQILKNLISTLGGAEFTVTKVHDLLVEQGNGFEGDRPKGRIAVVLNQLMNAGYIEQTEVGTGKIPHRYKQKVVNDENPLL